MHISPLHCLTWDASPLTHLAQVEQLLDAGANWIQLRQKKATEQEKLQTAIAAAKLCQKYKATLIINDSPQICLESGANGVHLGLSDCPIPKARELLGKDAIIGGTANTQLQALQRVTENCNYIGLGPWRATKTKENLSEILGEAGIKTVADLNLKIPVIAIGGIALQDVGKILSLGVQGIAVSSGIVAAKDIKEAFSLYIKELKRIP
ncbi:MAG: thiamine phosphate synthase [Fibromonadaceae bacterium]|jgi:thiamine-phosphate pyrophosphorylase|nr:thiamine phosphate synthase [Fibromonadaceae bacterium]